MTSANPNLNPGSVAGQSGASTYSSGRSWETVEGTKMTLFKFLVNCQFPEKNPAQMKFTLVSNYDEHQGLERIIREAAITVPHHADFSKWEAYSEKPNHILFKGPSRSYWESPAILWSPECHNVKNKKTHPFPNDRATKKAHKATKLAIKKDPLCKVKWWQAEIPKGKDQDTNLVLDNTILSGTTSNGDKIRK
jgi:hypothetical protein